MESSGGGWLLNLIEVAGGALEAASLLTICVLLVIAWTVYKTRAALAKQIESSAKQQDAVTARFAHAEDERVALMKKLDAQDIINTSLQEKLEGAQGAARGLTERLKTSDATVAQLRAEIDALRVKTAVLEKELSALTEQKRGVEAELEKEKLRVLTQQHEIDGLRGKVAELERRVAELSGANHAMQTLMSAWRVVEPEAVKVEIGKVEPEKDVIK